VSCLAAKLGLKRFFLTCSFQIFVQLRLKNHDLQKSKMSNVRVSTGKKVKKLHVSFEWPITSIQHKIMINLSKNSITLFFFNSESKKIVTRNLEYYQICFCFRFDSQH
jgi:hypothetical protein